jgi:hypothetical protein
MMNSFQNAWRNLVQRVDVDHYTRKTIISLMGIHPIIHDALRVHGITELSPSRDWENALLIMVIELIKQNDYLSQHNQELLRGHYAPPIQVKLNDLTKEEATKVLQQIAGQLEWFSNEDSE